MIRSIFSSSALILALLLASVALQAQAIPVPPAGLEVRTAAPQAETYDLRRSVSFERRQASALDDVFDAIGDFIKGDKPEGVAKPPKKGDVGDQSTPTETATSGSATNSAPVVLIPGIST